MPFILSFENRGFPGSCVAVPYSPPGRSSIIRSVENPKSYLTNDEINGALGEGRAWHMSTNLVINITPDASERAPLVFSNTRSGVNLGMRVWFRQSITSPSGFLRDTFAPTPTQSQTAFAVGHSSLALIVAESGNRLEIQAPERLQSLIEEHFIGAGIAMPQDGFISIALGIKPEGVPDGNAYYYYYLIKCTFRPPVIAAPGPPAARPTDTSFAIGNYTCVPEPYETLYTPALQGSFHYNFYQLDEESLLSSRRKSYALQKIAKIPKYIELVWDAAPAIAERADQSIGSGIFIDGGFVGGTPSDTIGEIFGSKASSSRLAKLVGGDSTLSFGLAEMENSILNEAVRRSDDPDAIVGPNEYSRYIGYVILKERYNTEEDLYEPIDLIVVLDRRKNRIIDTKVAYGDRYRYSVRTVYKFVNVDQLPLFQDPDTIIDRPDVTMVFDGGTELRYAYYFDSKFSNTIEVYAYEENRPSAPVNVKLFPNSLKKNIFITWNMRDTERDIVAFNIYRKEIGRRFIRLNRDSIGVRNNFYLDENIKSEKDYVYAIESIDVHNNTSRLSVQYTARINSNSSTKERRNESPTRIFLNKEVEVESNLIPPKEEKEFVKFGDKLKVIINPLFKDVNPNFSYLLKVTSLDTFMEKTIKLKFSVKTIDHPPADAPATAAEIIQDLKRQSDATTQDAARGRIDVDAQTTGGGAEHGVDSAAWGGRLT
jgi:hypothetical protein